MLRRVKQLIALVVGWLLIAVGVAGLVLPIIPGWALIFVGAMVLGFDAASYLHVLDRLQRRFPRFGAWIDHVRRRLKHQPPRPAAPRCRQPSEQAQSGL